MSTNSEQMEAWQVELGMAVGVAFVLMDIGADLHMPWWAMLIVATGVACVAPRELAALRHDRAAIGKALLFGTGSWVLWEVGCWIGENGAEWLHRGWRWWVVAVLIALGFRAWEARTPRDP